MEDIKSAKVVFEEGNREYFLSTKPKSNCHFFEEFTAGNDTVRLRLDWSDMDINGHPTLDADFFDAASGKKRKLKGKRKSAHHTLAAENNGRSYEWEFSKLNLKFKVIVCFEVSISEHITMGCSCSAEVIKGLSSCCKIKDPILVLIFSSCFQLLS